MGNTPAYTRSPMIRMAVSEPMLMNTFFAVDLLVSSVVFVRYLGQEGTRYSIGYRWVYVVALLTVGLSFALPLFLYVRESHLPAKAGLTGSY